MAAVAASGGRAGRGGDSRRIKVAGAGTAGKERREAGAAVIPSAVPALPAIMILVGTSG